MFRKSASIKRFSRPVFFRCLLTIGLLISIDTNVSAQEKLNLAEPLKKCRAYGPNNGLTKIIASDNVSNIILTTDNYSIISINPDTNLENWKSSAGGRLELNAYTDDNNLFFLTVYEKENKQKTFTLNSISLKTGITNWQKKFKDYSSLKLKQVKNNELLFLTADDKTLLASEKNNGEILWIKKLSGPIVSIENNTKDERLNILLEDRLLRAIAKSGAISEEAELKKNDISNAVVKDTYLLLGDSTGEISKISLEENKNNIIWRIKAGAGISGLIEYQDEVLVTSLDNFIYLYSVESGKLRWKKRVAGRISIKPLIFDSSAIVINSGDNSMSVIDISDGKVINQLKIETDNYFSGPPVISGIYFVSQTSKGMYFYVNTSVSCK